jgi:AcrR family transcriptional regulator
VSDERPRPPARPRRAARTQEERSAETRAKVISAAAECVADLGFKGATMSAIAQRAGVSWGAIQHQFGEKEAILDAVLEASLAEFEAGLAPLRETAAEPAVRVSAFVDVVRRLLRGPSYRAFVEIQLNRARDEARAGAAEAGWSAHVAEVLVRVWRHAFGDLGVSAAALRRSRRYAFMVLSGIAAEAMLFPGVDFSRQHLTELETNLVRMFAGGE